MGKEKIVQGENSGYQAINLAYILGAERVILLGYDMSGTGEHWFGKHDGTKGLSTNTYYPKFIDKYKRMKPEAYGLEVINSTRKTCLDCFPMVELDFVLSNTL